MNRKQRMQNRDNVRKLEYFSHVCPECGERGKHWLLDPMPSIGGDCSGWTCKKFYGPDGRRIAP